MKSENEIIEDARVLTADYLPNKMVHREGERQEIARNLRPVLQDEPPVDMLIHGRPGTGKTAMSKYVVKQLKKQTFVQTPYVNCFSQKSRFEIFYELLNRKATVPRDGTSTEKVISRFEEKVRENPTIITVDEVDQIRDDDALFELSRFRDAGLIMIANDPNVFANFDERVSSRFSGIHKIRFKPYDQDQLVDILKLRREHGLRDGSISTEQLRRIAASAGGDARVAINSLRLAAQTAENQDMDSITEETVEESVSDAHDRNRLESLEKLNRHQKKLYKILQQEGELGMKNLFNQYRDEVDDPRSKRTVRRYLNKMQAYDVVEKLGGKKGASYRLED